MAAETLATTAAIITAAPAVARPLDTTAPAPDRPLDMTATVATPDRPLETTATVAGTAAVTAASRKPRSGQSGPAAESGTHTRIARTPRLAHA
jgi:hypothetical protein